MPKVYRMFISLLQADYPHYEFVCVLEIKKNRVFGGLGPQKISIMNNYVFTLCKY